MKSFTQKQRLRRRAAEDACNITLDVFGKDLDAFVAVQAKRHLRNLVRRMLAVSYRHGYQAAKTDADEALSMMHHGLP